MLPGGRTLSGDMLNVVRDELNVKEVGFLSSVDGIATLTARPNYRSLGRRFGKQTNDAANAIRALDQAALSAWQAGGGLTINVDGTEAGLEPDDLEVVQEASGNLVVKGEGAYTLALDPELDDELRAEGLARELVNRIQRLRKDAGLEITDRIELAIAGPDSVREAVATHEVFIGGETLAERVVVKDAVSEGDLAHVRSVEIDGTKAWIGLAVTVD